MNQYEIYRSAIKDIALPCACIDLDALDDNIKQIALRANGKTIRVASKSIRSVELIRRILNASPVYKGIMAFSCEEAIYLAENGFDDILVGYPTAQVSILDRVASSVKQGKNITLMVDSVEQVSVASDAAKRAGVEIRLCLDADMSTDYPGLHFGVWRSPIRSVSQALKLFRSIQSHGNVRMVGIMGYEAQVAGVGDEMPGQAIKNTVVRLLKRKSITRISTKRRAIVEELNKAGAQLEWVNGGGTGSLDSTAEEPWVTELTAGSGFFSPTLFDYYSNFRYQPAAFFALEVVRKPKEGMVTCHGGGYIASGSAGVEKLPVPWLPNGLSLTKNEGAGEVQTPILGKPCDTLKPGMPVFFRHAKAGELCERFNKLNLISGGKITGETSTYRGDGQGFV